MWALMLLVIAVVCSFLAGAWVVLSEVSRDLTAYNRVLMMWDPEGERKIWNHNPTIQALLWLALTLVFLLIGVTNLC